MKRFLTCAWALGALATCSVANAPEDPIPGSTGSGAGGTTSTTSTESGGTGGDAGGKSGCDAPEVDCGGECADTSSDVAHCGACDHACAGPQSCVEGACKCPDGTELCGGDCVDLQSDLAHCGGCDTACDGAQNAGAVCQEGSCGLKCQAGFDDCDEMPGCELPVTADVANCGGCGVACPEGDHAKATCMEGMCGMSCAPGYDDCDMAPQNGCEVSLLDDPKHCGGCNKVCKANDLCIGGACQPTAPNCKVLHAQAPNAPSGIYWLDPDGVGPLKTFQGYCDMTTNGGGWTLVVLTNGNVTGHPNAAFADAKDNPSNLNGNLVADLDQFDYFMGTNYWNAIANDGLMMWKVGDNQAKIYDVVQAKFKVYQTGERINWTGYTAILGGIPNIDYQNDGHLYAKDQAAPGATVKCVVEQEPSVGLHGPWFYTTCSNASPWCTGHGDCSGFPIRMQWRNQSQYTTAKAAKCSNHGEIFVR